MAVRMGSRHRARRPNLLAADAASISAGIALVDGGMAASVVLVGFRFGERLLPEAILQARAAGLLLTTSRQAGGRVSITIRRPVG